MSDLRNSNLISYNTHGSLIYVVTLAFILKGYTVLPNDVIFQSWKEIDWVIRTELNIDFLKSSMVVRISTGMPYTLV